MKATVSHICFGLNLLMPIVLSSQELPIDQCIFTEKINEGYSKSEELKAAMDTLVKSGVPGCAMAVYSTEGLWAHATGFAKIEDRSPMQLCHLHYLQSISKTYLAAAVLKLYEQGLIELDSAITDYLPDVYHKYVTSADKVTVRMLLNHTSGIPEYNFAPAYVTTLLQHPDYPFTPEEYLTYIEGKDLSFSPGERYSYRNTNYVLLALMVDAITGDHARYISETIFHPMQLEHTHYRHEPGYLGYPTLVNSYWDRYGNGIVENASQLQRSNVAALIGDDGIVATSVDAIRFLRALLEGEFLSPSTLTQMQVWSKDAKGNPRYGLGLAYNTIAGHTAIGHSGGGIGAGSELYYFPEKNLYMFIAINLGTVTESSLHEKAGQARDRIFEILMN
jgi:D-alanyl-D-alanine carboxypeptidase